MSNLKTMDLFDFPRIIPESPKLMKLKQVGINYAMEKNMN